MAELSGDTGVHTNQISQWGSQLLEERASLFQRDGDKSLRRFKRSTAGPR